MSDTQIKKKTWEEKKAWLNEHAGLVYEVGSILADRTGRESAAWDTAYESCDEIYEMAAKHIINDLEEEITGPRRVLVPYNLLVWVTVDVKTGEVSDLHASDIPDNYWPDTDASGMPTDALYVLSDWDEESDPVDSQLAEKARRAIDAAEILPRLRIEESSR